ncbi:L,D-transpeptidase [Akkermansiaceae bacterium]|nr:L,D-transpeptidase [Akkermansiaceae bacterium]
MRPSPANRSWPEADTRLEVSIQQQSLTLFRNGKSQFSAPVSTAARGIGFEEGSFQTPTGHFIVRERIGEGAPLRTFFNGRLPKGIGSANSDDAILTRILWLEGLDENNRNSYRRYIYFHGTHEEHLIGQPASHGCIRLKNRDMLTLFDLTPIFTRVDIL